MTISGIVETGKQLGRTIGFPTANILAETEPETVCAGVFAGAIWLDGENAPRPCMVNLGVHPTVPDGKPTVEAHILDFSGNVYGCKVVVELSRFLRSEKRFGSLSELQEQLAKDLAATREWAAETNEKYRWQGFDSTAIR